MAKKIIITTNAYKKELLKDKILEDRKIYTYQEFKKLFYFDYNEKTILYIMEKYKIKRSIATIYLENMYFIEDKEYSNKKLMFLKQLKEELLENNLLIINKLFLTSLNNKEILFYKIPITKELKHLIEKLQKTNTIQIENEKRNYQHTIYAFPTIEEEVVFIASDIIKKAKEGISFHHMYLVNINEEYKKVVKRIFPMFHIPFSLNEEQTLFSTPLGKEFIRNFSSDIKTTLKKIEEKISNQEEQTIYKEIISIVNKYAFEKEKERVKELIFYDLKQTKIKGIEKENVVKESLLDYPYGEEDYVYLLSFNQGVIPALNKEEDYLSDKEKEELSISTTLEKNKFEKETTMACIRKIKNLIITYIENGKNALLSNINEILAFPVIKELKIPLQYAHLYNKIKLTSLLDTYYKYGSINDNLKVLYQRYKDLPYKTYTHQFTGIKKEDLKEFLGNQLNLSYTKINDYYSCPFSYYINYILKLNKEEDTFAIVIGNLFHAVLEHHKEDFDLVWEKELKELNYVYNEKETFFLEKLKEELRFAIERIHEQENFTELHEELYEENVVTSKSGDLKITFSGKIDKIKYKKEGNKTIVGIIDYKTGNLEEDLSLIGYGIHLQLPIYIYLAKQTKKLENMEIAGIYLQKIINSEITLDNKHSYEELKKKKLLLHGYSCSDKNTLSLFDTSYMDSNIIKNMKVVKNGDFSAYSKVLSKKELDALENMAIKKIEEAMINIEKANFKIEPKKVGNKFDSCKYCHLKDICFHTREDILELEEQKLENILGSE